MKLTTYPRMDAAKSTVAVRAARMNATRSCVVIYCVATWRYEHISELRELGRTSQLKPE